MKRCGDNQWWVEGSQLVIQRARKWTRRAVGAVSLFIAAGAGVALVARPEQFLAPLLILGVSLAIGLDQLLGRWRAVLERGAGSRLTWSWGLVVPLYRRERPLTAFEYVRLHTSEGQDQRTPPAQVWLQGPGEAVLLSSTHDDGEALALAEAVARHASKGLRVDGGRVRSFEEMTAREGSHFRSWRPTTASRVAPAGAPGARIQVGEEDGRLVMTLPAPGWRGYGARLATGVTVMGLALAPLSVMTIWLWGWLSWTVLLILLGAPVVALGLGGRFLKKTLEAMRTSCRLTLSRQGLEVTWAGGEERKPQRLAAHLIRDIDVREHRREGERGTRPMLVIERESGELLVLGEGLRREELEWAAVLLRQRLA